MHLKGDQEVEGSTTPGRQHSLVEIDREIFSTVIFSISLIQERHLSVSGKRMCTILVNYYCPVEVWLFQMTSQHESTGFTGP